ncbi:beta-lactamase family protein [Aestuariicella hydrocarbonica]|uniref:Beta-lactamase family protein n=1 Tax=Pseudomaricurvus hydrocarbonicus TaxID=1470433 RepID=A0A9E5JPJ2_9GAMM|nr:serine hydrolase domain-containing protein [Aestuariicella hydrocarbonica]NHO64124.1 beta-lactamase family protein [Aestuariicella hydrocarbonica]
MNVPWRLSDRLKGGHFLYDVHFKSQGVKAVLIEGSVSLGFEGVKQAFTELFTDYHEVGAAVSLVHRGVTVVDLWAGSRDKAEAQPWRQDTRSNVFSASKAVVAIAILQLVEKRLLSLEQPVADLWPEFAQNGKQDITVRQVLTHRSGVNAFQGKVPDTAIYDWSMATGLIAQESPWWEPGSEQGYSPILFGWILGELVCRVSGCNSFNDYVAQNIARPLGLGWKFGLSSGELAGIADMAPLKVPKSAAVNNVKSGSLLTNAILGNPQGVTAKAFANPPSLMIGTNGVPWRQAQIPAANGHASAADLAIFYGALADLDDERLLTAEARSWCWEEQTQGQDNVLHCPLSLSLGFMRLLPRNIQSERFFCHPGAGGSLGYADASEGFGFGYATRAMGQSITLDDRADHLLQAVYAAVRD